MGITSLEQVERIIVYDDEGAGRCHLGKYAVQRSLQEKLPKVTFLAAGLRKPDSGRVTIHPLPANTIKYRHGLDVLNDPVHLLVPEDVNGLTIALGLTSTVPHAFLLENAFDVLIAPAQDPFHDLANELEPIATEIGLIAWLFEWVLLRKFNELGTKRDESGIVKPRRLVTFQPMVEPEYDLRSPMNIRHKTDLDRPMEPWKIAKIGKPW